MFWNDPHMYGMTFPYKEFTPTPPMTPFLGQFYPYQNIPRILPNYGTLPHVGLPTIPFDPFVTKGTFKDPFMMNQIPAVPFGQVPFGQVPFGQVPIGQVPFGQLPIGQNLPFCNWYRPF